MMCPLQSVGYCSVAVSSLLAGANLDSFFWENKQHSEKTGETQLNPNHAVFLVVFCLNPLHAELRGDSETYFTKCKMEFLAINCCVLR